jgi:hypothetical protein
MILLANRDDEKSVKLYSTSIKRKVLKMNFVLVDSFPLHTFPEFPSINTSECDYLSFHILILCVRTQIKSYFSWLKFIQTSSLFKVLLMSTCDSKKKNLE